MAGKKVVNKAIEVKRGSNITVKNCNLVGVQFDEKATDAIKIIAEGLIENAKALGTLAYAMRASGVNIDTMLRVGGDK